MLCFVITSMRYVRNSAEARWSEIGVASVAATAPAAAALASSTRLPRSDASARGARTTVGATAPRAMRAVVQTPAASNST